MANVEKPSPYKLKIWFAYTPEERSYVLLRGYQAGVLSSQDLEPFLNTARLNHATNILFPILAFPLIKYGFYDPLQSKILRRHPHSVGLGLSGVALGAFWLLWANWSPIYRNMDKKREELLEVIEKRIGPYMTQLNDVLPRFWTEGEVNRKIRRLYNQRNGWLTGYLYAYEEVSEPLVDESSFAKLKKNRIIR